MLNSAALQHILWQEIDRYKYPLEGLSMDITFGQSASLNFNLTYFFRNGGGAIRYGETIPNFWLDMDEQFVRKNFQTMIRNVIKSSLSVEIERLFGWDKGFNPL